jgi:hypothetical protein
MDRELEIGGAASAGGWLRWRKAHVDVPPGTPCANCGTVLQGPYCHACGQLAENFERSVWALLVEGVESFFHFDGRFWQTLPKLALRPGELTRDYLEGKRAFQIPPLRLFLVVLLIVFFVGGLNLGADKAVKVNIDRPASAVVPATSAAPKAPTAAGGPEVQAAIAQATATKGLHTGDVYIMGKKSPEAKKWLEERIAQAANNPEYFKLVLESWGHRFAVLMAPISAILLSMLFIFQKRFYVFDHMIFSIHSLSFQGVLFSLVLLLSALTSAAWLLLLLAPVHLFVHMRGAYRTSIAGTLLRMFVLGWGSFIGFIVLMVGLVWVGLSAIGGH